MGIPQMAIGALAVVVGLALTALSSILPIAGASAIFAGAIVGGGVLFLVGGLQWLNWIGQGHEGRAEIVRETQERIVLRSMIAVALTDGQLDEKEIELIRRFFAVQFNHDLSPRTIKSEYNKMKRLSGRTHVHEDVWEHLDAVFKQLAGMQTYVLRNTVTNAYLGAALMAQWEGVPSLKQQQTLGRIQGRLGLAPEETAQIEASAPVLILRIKGQRS
jgi:hypothetical protein